MSVIYSKLANADMLVIASPVYFYGLSAQLKAVIDRCHNPIRDTFHIKKVALILVGAASLPELFDSILTQYRLCLNFFHIEDAGHVLVRGAKEKGGVRDTKALEEAEVLGRAV
jgi:NAD(P)H-dependent FMN reductase